MNIKDLKRRDIDKLYMIKKYSENKLDNTTDISHWVKYYSKYLTTHDAMMVRICAKIRHEFKILDKYYFESDLHALINIKIKDIYKK